MSNELEGRTALVTGGNRGIGLAMARALGIAGAAVAIVARDRARTDEAIADLQAEGIDASAHIVELSDRASCQAAVAAAVRRHGQLDILVNNAGINIRKRPELYSEEEIERVIATDLLVPFHLAVSAYQACMETRGGKIINVGSLLSTFGGAVFAPYSAAKGGLLQLTRSLAIAWAPQDIQVNAILPGWIDTDLTVSARREVAGLNEKVLTRTPAGRWGDTKDFGAAAVFLAGPGSRYITGTSISIDGGYSVAI